MKTLKILNVTLPSKWSEISPKQVLRISYYLSHGFPETEFLLKLGTEFAGLKPNGTSVLPNGDIGYMYYDRKRGNLVFTVEQLARIASAVRWVTGKPDIMEPPFLDGYNSPNQYLDGVSLEQFITGDIACSHYIISKDSLALQTMVACFYPRGTFDPEKVQAEAERLSYKPTYELEAVLLWFTGVKEMLRNKYPHVFTGGTDSGIVPDGVDVYLGIISNLNDGDISRNQVIKKTDVHEALYELEQKIKAVNASKK